jgi:predicted DNA-binding protein (UPF0251 family)
MGAVKVDTEKQARSYEVKYALNDAAGVKALLRDRHRIGSARFTGDYNACDILIDLNSAIYNAGLTERQTEAIAWVYGVDLTQKDAAEIMAVSREAITQFIGEAASRIAAVFARWEYGEVSVEFTDAEEIEEEAV